MNRQQSFGLGFRLSLYVSAISLAVVAVIITGIFYYSYRLQIQGIEENATDINNLTVPQITTAVWDFATQQVEAQVDALSRLRHVSHVEVNTPDQSFAYGQLQQDNIIDHHFDLIHDQGGQIGTLNIQFSRDSAWRSVTREALTLTGYVLVPLLFMAATIILLFRQLVTRHLDSLAAYARSLTVDTLDKEFAFTRAKHDRRDELDRLLSALNDMRSNMLVEIRQRRQAERKLSESEENYQEVFNATGDAIFIHDLQTGKILDVNQSVLDMYGYTYEEALGADLTKFSATTPNQSPEEAFKRNRLAAEGTPQLFEWQARHASGEIFWVEVFLKSMQPQDGGRLLASVRDISSRKAAEDNLLHMQKMDTIGQMAGGIAHDFNNLLTGILGGAEMIGLESKDPEIQHHVEMIIRTAKRGADLTGQLLAFARRGPVVMRRQDLHEIIHDVTAILEHSIDKRIQLKTVLDASSSTVKGDRAQLQSAILNLGLNARDAMVDGGQLTISTASVALDQSFCDKHAASLDPGTYVEICVQDTGTGMTEEVQQKAYEPFFTTKKIGEGTGLGLASVYGTIKGHKGIVTLNSAVGMGTAFRLYLPVSREAPPTPKDEDISLQPGIGNILIIEDEEVVRTLAQRTLEQAGYKTLTAEDGMIGMDIYRQHIAEIDLVLLDMIMPRMNGQETFLAIRNINPHASIIISSGFARDETVSNLLIQGNASFLRKPFRQVELTLAVEELLFR